MIYVKKAIGRALKLIFSLFPSRKESRPDKKELKKALVLLYGDIGDMVLFTPFSKNFKKNAPQAKLYVLIKKPYTEMLELSPEIDGIFNFNYKFKDFFSTLRLIRKEKFDVVFDPKGYFITLLLTYLSGVKYRVGYDLDDFGFYLTHARKEVKGEHTIKRSLELLKLIGFKISDEYPEIILTRADEKYADEIFRKNKLSGHFVLGLHPEGTWKSKIWPWNKFVDVINYFIKRHKAKILVFGLDESKLHYFKQNAIDPHSVVIQDKTTIRQWLAMIKRCSMFIGNDSSGTHSAQAFNIPTITLFGSTDERMFGTYRKNATTIKSRRKCGYCAAKERTLLQKAEHCRCIENIEVQDVIKNAERLMRR